ncbi:MAG: hemerythrin domain-containing protein [Leptospiraceae bacterium]|nr:hemerythrin domain-containing protein [Leptospiraceae bacterium]
MNAYIETLKQEHRRLFDHLRTLRETDIESLDGKKQLFEVMEHLLAHLKLEDDELYLVLRQAAAKDPEIANTLEHFAKDLLGIADEARDFFDRYRSHGNPESFHTDFDVLFEKVKNRMHKEELVLFAMYAEIKETESN